MAKKSRTNPEYWADRAVKNSLGAWKDEAKIEKALEEAYKEVLAKIKSEVADLYASYGIDNTLEYSSLMRPLTVQELDEYKLIMERILKQYGLDAERIISEIQRLRDMRKITILDSKINMIEAELYKLGHLEQQTIGESLSRNYESIYYKSIFDSQQILGIGIPFQKLNTRAVQTAVAYPWSGAMFSDLVWDNKQVLLKDLKKTITTGIIRGESYQKMARNLNDSVLGGKGYKSALRIIRTETAHVITEATAEGYKKSNLVRQYRLIATLDSRTSHICQKLDNKVFNLDDMQVGVNAPVMHVHCRSCIAPYFADDDLSDSTRIARDKTTGRNYKVQASMTFEEWYQKHVR